MAETFDLAVTPNSLTSQPVNNSAQGTTGEFGTSTPNMPTSTMPAPDTGQSSITAAENANNAAMSKASSSGGSSGGGMGGIGDILGGVGKIAGLFGLFSEGGPVGFAQGGQAGPDPKHQATFIEGYLTGAHHQQSYGGTPDTLAKAAQEIKQMLMEKIGGGQHPPAMADGGYTSAAQANNANMQNNDADLVRRALEQSLGLNQQNQVNPGSQAFGTYQNPANQSSQSDGSNAFGTYQVPQQNVDQGNPNNVQQNSNPQQGYMDNVARGNNPPLYAKGGFLNGDKPNGYAVGGPPDTQGAPMQAPPGAPMQGQPPQGGQPPLKPGQVFQGDGSVKGPGGPTDDVIPAKLSNGEFVFSEPAVQFFGVDKLTKMNEQGKQGFMQAIQQVQQNQGGGQPQQPPMAPGAGPQSPPMQNPMPPNPNGSPAMAAKGGMMSKGFCAIQ